MYKFCLAAAFVLGSFAPANAGSQALAPLLKHEATISGGIVRIGDLVENAGSVADIPIFRAPDLGHSGVVPASRVIDAVRPYGLKVEANGHTEVMVVRAAREIGRREIEEQIVAALGASYRLASPAALTVTFDEAAQPLLVEASSGDPRVLRASYDRYSGRYDVTFEMPASSHRAQAGQRLRYTGTIAETVEVAIPTRPLGRGEIIRASDVVIERQPKSAVRPGTLTSAEQVIGFAARRPLPIGQPLTTADVMKPELVVKNEAVTIFYQAPGMMLSVRGKALESGADGELVTVLNAQAKRTLQGVVAGPGRVNIVVTSAATQASEITGSIAPANRTE